MAKIFGQSQGVDINGSVTAWVISGDTATIIATSFTTSNTGGTGDVLIIEASDVDGKMYIPLYADNDITAEGADGEYPNQFRWRLRFDSSLYNLSGGSFAIQDAQVCDVSGITALFSLPNSCSREQTFENAVYGNGMTSYNTKITHSLIIPRYIFNISKFVSVYKDMGNYMIYIDDNKEFAYKIVTTEETLVSLNDIARRAFNFKLPIR